MPTKRRPLLVVQREHEKTACERGDIVSLPFKSVLYLVAPDPHFPTERHR
jgi:hypothetical protein